MAHFHICHPGHDCDRDKQVANLRDVGEKIVFAVNQFKESLAETITVNILPTAV